MKKYRKKQNIELISIEETGMLVQNEGDSSNKWIVPTKVFNKTYEEIKKEVSDVRI